MKMCSRVRVVLRLYLSKRLPVIIKLLDFVDDFFKALIFATGFFNVFRSVTNAFMLCCCTTIMASKFEVTIR